MTIFLDLDGVCFDFVTPALTAVGQEPKKIFKKWPKGDYRYIEKFNLWPAIESKGFHFWTTQPMYPWFPRMYDMLKMYGDVVFLSSPGYSAHAAGGKVLLLRSIDKNAQWILTKHKELLANSDSILIDDCDKNVDDFKIFGGRGILFPQIWNSADEPWGDGKAATHSVATKRVLDWLKKELNG